MPGDTVGDYQVLHHGFPRKRECRREERWYPSGPVIQSFSLGSGAIKWEEIPLAGGRPPRELQEVEDGGLVLAQ